MDKKERERVGTIVQGMFCSCEEQPLGLPFVLTHGCLVHDSCQCHVAEHDPVPSGDEACAWCDSYIALLKVIASLDESTRERMKLAYSDERSR